MNFFGRPAIYSQLCTMFPMKVFKKRDLYYICVNMKYPRPIYKIILCGEGGVGKSTLLRSKVNEKYTPVEQLTIGIDFDCYAFEAKDNSMTLLAFDLGGQEHFQFIHKAFIGGAKAGIIVYDLTKFRTFLKIPHWIELLQSEYPSIPILIVGSKKDIVDEETLIHAQKEWKIMKNDLPDTVNIIGHYQISSKNPDETKQVFRKIQDLAMTWKQRLEESSQIGISSKQ